jgi:hypothetical protein
MQPTHTVTQALPLPDLAKQDRQAEIVLHRLLRHMTLVQLQALVTALDGVLAAGGYGEIGIVMEKAHTRRIRVTISQDITPVTELLKQQQEKPHGQT